MKGHQIREQNDPPAGNAAFASVVPGPQQKNCGGDEQVRGEKAGNARGENFFDKQAEVWAMNQEKGKSEPPGDKDSREAAQDEK